MVQSRIGERAINNNFDERLRFIKNVILLKKEKEKRKVSYSKAVIGKGKIASM